MRITAGCFRGRELKLPPAAGVRPTPAKVRQALFNIVGDVRGWHVLDLFAGSGLVALEAISRGAAHVTSIERSRRVCRHLEHIRKTWQLSERWQVHLGEVHAALSHFAGRHFDLVFADPPYGQGYAASTPAWLDDAGMSCRILIVEESVRVQPRWPEGWMAQPPRRYGDTCLHVLRPLKEA